MAGKEHNIQKQIVGTLRKFGFIVVQTDVMMALKFLPKKNDRMRFISYAKGQGYEVGTSDLLACKNGKTYFIEVKKWSIGKNGKTVARGKQSAVQIDFQKKVEEKGFKYFLIDSMESVQEMYKTIISS